MYICLYIYIDHYEFVTLICSPIFCHIPLITVQAEARKLGLVGWVRNTEAGTVEGQLQGQRSKVEKMQDWLKSTGSPKSHITKAEFKKEKPIEGLEHSSFNVVK
uniref:Acylphosphatase-1 n=1 Tax=Fundulus heteroclitus TaxID=8078 RepID=A0A3Q2PR54_FUNHE